jgi:hypothetical protein
VSDETLALACHINLNEGGELICKMRMTWLSVAVIKSETMIFGDTNLTWITQELGGRRMALEQRNDCLPLFGRVPPFSLRHD